MRPALASWAVPSIVEISPERIIEELLRLARLGMAQDKVSPEENRALALLVKYQLLDDTSPDTTEKQDPLRGFQLSPADLQTFVDEAARRLAPEAQATVNTTEPRPAIAAPASRDQQTGTPSSA